jgi:hypothetical protein
VGVSSGSVAPTQNRFVSEQKQITIRLMLIATFAIRLLTGMFLVGLVGSTVVVLISFYEDAVELFGKD